MNTVIPRLVFEVFRGGLAAVLLLLLGDFVSMFLYHVPEHVFGKFHCIVHHGKNRSFIHYAMLTRNPWVLLDGFLGALPHFLFIPLPFSFCFGLIPRYNSGDLF